MVRRHAHRPWEHPEEGDANALGDGMHIELYDHAHYFTITGNHLVGTPPTINDADAELKRGVCINAGHRQRAGSPY